MKRRAMGEGKERGRTLCTSLVCHLQPAEFGTLCFVGGPVSYVSSPVSVAMISAEKEKGDDGMQKKRVGGGKKRREKKEKKEKEGRDLRDRAISRPPL